MVFYLISAVVHVVVWLYNKEKEKRANMRFFSLKATKNKYILPAVLRHTNTGLKFKLFTGG